MEIKATVVQKLPTGLVGKSPDVGEAVFEHLVSKGKYGLAKDHESRICFGEKKYGQRLTINNGRDARIDLLQELLDALSYAMQIHLEGGEGFIDIFNKVTDLTQEVKNKLEYGDTY